MPLMWRYSEGMLKVVMYVTLPMDNTFSVTGTEDMHTIYAYTCTDSSSNKSSIKFYKTDLHAQDEA